MTNKAIDQPIQSTTLETKPAKRFDADKMMQDMSHAMAALVENAVEAQKSVETLLEIIREQKVQNSTSPKAD